MNTTYVILGVIALAVIFAISQYNKLVRLNVSVDEGDRKSTRLNSSHT